MGHQEDVFASAEDHAQWHVLRAGNRYGPCRLSELVEAICDRTIGSGDLIWCPGWSDWREARSVARVLSPSLVDIFECEQVASPKMGTPPPVLVHKFEMNFRSGDEPVSWTKHVPTIANLVLLAMIAAVLFALSALIFDGGRDGILCIAIEFALFLLISVGLFRPSKLFRISSLRFARSPAMATFLIVAMNGDRLPDAFDAWHGKRLASDQHTADHIQHLAQEHPSNKFLAFLVASHSAAQQSATAVRQLIDNFHSDAISLDVMLTTPNRDTLSKQAQKLRAAEARATLAWSGFLEILEAERSAVERAGREIYLDDPLRLLPKLLQDHAARQQVVQQHMDKTFKALATLNSAKGDLAEFLGSRLDQTRSPREPGVAIALADKSANEKLKKLIASVQVARAGVAGLERNSRIFNPDRRGLRTEIASAI